MGFFSDLKEDLSQAVNELMPAELLEEAAPEEDVLEAPASEGADALSVDVSLEEMLKNIDDVQLPEDMAPVDPGVSADARDAKETDVDLSASLAEMLEAIDSIPVEETAAEEAAPEEVEDKTEDAPSVSILFEDASDNSGDVDESLPEEPASETDDADNDVSSVSIVFSEASTEAEAQVEESFTTEPEPLPVEESIVMEPEPLPEEESIAIEPEPLPEEESIAIEPEPLPVEESIAIEPEPLPEEESIAIEPEPLPVEESIAIEPEPLPVEESIVMEPEQQPAVDELPGNAFVEEYSEAFAEALTEEQELQDNTNEQENKESKGEDEKMDSYGYANKQALEETGIITAGMQIHGDIVSEGSVDVIGVVEGNIDILGKLNITGHINGNSKAAEVYAESAKINGEVVSEGAVKIGDSSVIIGNITAKSAAIAGAVKGDIDVQGPVVLDASAIVMGNIKSKSVQINNGAVIEGMCSQCYADVSPTSFFDSYKTEIKNNKKNKDNNKENKDNKDNKDNKNNDGK